MSGYSDAYKDDLRDRFLSKWGPKSPLTDDAVTKANLAWNIARANAAEDELRRIKEALKTLKDVIR